MPEHPAHTWMLDIVEAAEELGYYVRSVSLESIELTRPELKSFTDITIKGRLINGAVLRQTLMPADREKA